MEDDLLGDINNFNSDNESIASIRPENDDLREEVQDDVEESNENQVPTEPVGDPVKPKVKRTVRPQARLNPARLKGPRGISILENVFNDFKFCGKGHEKTDLQNLMKKMEHWAHRLFPRFQFDDCLAKIETLGSKKEIHVHVKKIRLGMVSDDVQVNVDDDDNDQPNENLIPRDAFDELLSQQLDAAINSEVNDSSNDITSPHHVSSLEQTERTSLGQISLSVEQKERMLKNKKLAEERRLSRMKHVQSQNEYLPENVGSNESESLVNNMESQTETREMNGVEVMSEIDSNTLQSNEMLQQNEFANDS